MGAFLSSGRSPVSEVAEAGGGEAAVIDAPVDRRAALGGGEVVESSNGSVAAGGDTSRTGLIGSVRPTPSRGGGLFLDTSDILLNGLKNAGAITQVPYMKEAAGVLLQVVNTIQAVRDNQDAFHRLVDHAGCIILSTTRTMKPPKEITGDMESALKKIRDVVLKIEKLSDNKTRRRKVKRAFSAGSDKVEIGKLREDLDTAVLVFGVSILLVSASLIQLISTEFQTEFQVDAAIILNADINELTQCVRQLMNEDPRGSRAGAADGPSSDPSSATPSPLPACSSGDSTPLASIEVSNVNIQDGAFNHLSGDIDGSNEGEGTQSISAPNFASGIDGNVHMNSSVASHSRSRSRGSRRRTARASPSPSVVVLPEDDDHSQTLEDPPPLSSLRRSPPASPRANPQSTSFSGIKIKNGAFNCVNSPCNVTNKGSGTQTFYGSNIATNVGGDVMMNCGNVTTITTSNSNNDYSRRYYGSRSSRLRGRSSHPQKIAPVNIIPLLNCGYITCATNGCPVSARTMIPPATIVAALSCLAISTGIYYVARSPPRRRKILKQDERVLVIGASSGIGRSIAHEYAARGAKVCVMGRRAELLKKVLGECDALGQKGKTTYMAADFTNVEDLVRLRQFVEAGTFSQGCMLCKRFNPMAEWGGIDTLIVAAGVSALQPLMTVAGVGDADADADATSEGITHAVETAKKAMNGNYFGPLAAAVAFIPLLTRTSPSPSILLVSSLAAVIPAPSRTLYASTKAASLVLYQALSIEHPSIRFSAILPYTVEGDFRASAVDAGPVREADPSKHGLKREVVARRCVQAIDAGEKAVFLPAFYRAGLFLYWVFPAFVEWRARKKYGFTT
ncbi:hypothetical protein EYR36_011953 [Pleurotus pulmonarius]|nr:hypothetical protein EYR36_011953 [Pleurotus pulmonarius]